MSYYNNLISLPILFVLACVLGELTTLISQLDSIYTLRMFSIFIIICSCVLGFSLSISAFALNKLISATSMMVANNVNKFCLILLSEIFVQPTLDKTASVSGMYVLLLGWLYSQPTKHFSRILFIIGTLAFVVINTIFAWKHTAATSITIRLNSTIAVTNQTFTARLASPLNNIK